ncbi:MAG: diaminopimelate epimerase [Pseudomonas sp.]
MTRFYDARANIYAVSTPDALRDLGIAVARTAAQASADRETWAKDAIRALCDWPPGTRPADAKAHRCDGLLIGPFQQHAPFDVLIVNTDGTLAERSGNGLTIFAQALTETGHVGAQGRFELKVHHDKHDSASPVSTWIEPATLQGQAGFWLDLGKPAFGPAAVGAQAKGLGEISLAGRALSRVNALSRLEPDWDHSVFVRIGNPHCVTLVRDNTQLPAFQALHEPPLSSALTRIAFAEGDLGTGEPCPAGVNLQWACVASPSRIVARVFERGEGPTASSGTSASAVACAAWHAGQVSAGLIEIEMPGGTAPVRLVESGGELQQVALFGVARRT